MYGIILFGYKNGKFFVKFFLEIVLLFFFFGGGWIDRIYVEELYIYVINN